MLPHMLHEGRAPGPDCDWIYQQQPGVVAAVQNMSAQYGRTAKIVCDDIRRGQPPMVEQGGEHPVLDTERDVLSSALFRLSVAEKIVDVDATMPGKFTTDPAPHMGAERRPMHQDDRRAIAECIPRDALAAIVEALRECPIRLWQDDDVSPLKRTPGCRSGYGRGSGRGRRGCPHRCSPSPNSARRG